MRFLAFTDIHGSYESVDRIISSDQGADGIIIGGDLTTYGSPEEGEKAIRVFQNCGLPVFAVAGNMDSPEFDSKHEALGVSINARGMMLGEVGLFGVSASPFTSMNTPYEIEENEIARRAEMGWKDVSAARWKIFVPHSPPRDTKLDKIMLGRHVGSTAVRSFIEQHQPDVVVCGHIHEARGTDTIGKTKIVNCGPAGKGYYAVIVIGESISVEARG
jgi:Icc-related predicted phosphoesterase